MKMILILLALLVIMVFVLLAGAWSMFGEKITAAQSVRELDKGLYYLEYKGDYGFQKYLDQGGASSEAEMAAYITSFLSGGFMKAEPASQKFGCSSLYADNLFGRNFDYPGDICQAMIVHAIPKDGYESYSTCWLPFLGFGDAWKPEGFANQFMALASLYVPLDGINEKGLCVADLVNGDNARTDQNTGKTDLTTTSAIRLLLDRAATVEEAVALLGQYDMHSSIDTSHHLAIADASGRSVVVEYVDHVMTVTETPAVTNHYLSEGEKYGVGNPESHTRLDKLMALCSGVSTMDQMCGAMQQVSYSGLTRWSIVYDLNAKGFDFYWKMQFDQPYHFAFETGK